MSRKRMRLQQSRLHGSWPPTFARSADRASSWCARCISTFLTPFLRRKLPPASTWWKFQRSRCQAALQFQPAWGVRDGVIGWLAEGEFVARAAGAGDASSRWKQHWRAAGAVIFSPHCCLHLHGWAVFALMSSSRSRLLGWQTGAVPAAWRSMAAWRCQLLFTWFLNSGGVGGRS